MSMIRGGTVLAALSMAVCAGCTGAAPTAAPAAGAAAAGGSSAPAALSPGAASPAAASPATAPPGAASPAGTASPGEAASRAEAASPAAASPRASRHAPALLRPPAPAPGEIARETFTGSGDRTVIRAEARAGRGYWVHAACTATGKVPSITFEVVSARPGDSDDPIVASEVTCDGRPVSVGVEQLLRGPVSVRFADRAPNVTSGYVVLTPSFEVSSS